MQKLPLAVVVLAAGKGKRMKSDIPKVLHPLAGKPLLTYALENLHELNPDRVLLVVGHGAKQICSIFRSDSRLEFVEQKEQLGTGHAILQTRSALEDFDGNVLVLCGDMPFIRTETMKTMIDYKSSKQVACVLLTLKTSASKDFGRILRDSKGSVCGIVEHKDASQRQKTIDEYNAGVYCFDRSLLFQSVSGLDSHNAQAEYYLTDVVECFAKRGLIVRTVQTRDDREIFGVNSSEDLKSAERILAEV